MRILLIDTEDCGEIFKEVFESEGHTVVALPIGRTYAEGELGDIWNAHGGFDLLFVDAYELERMGLFQEIQRITKMTVLVLVTVHPMPKECELAQKMSVPLIAKSQIPIMGSCTQFLEELIRAKSTARRSS